MTDFARLTFFPWMRRGIARSIAQAADGDGVPTTAFGDVDARVRVGETEILHTFQARGPEAVVGLMPGQVIRMEPPPDTLDFESNYFPFIELVSPDVPWMFTPAAPKAQRLIPWLVLVVVEEREGVKLAASSGGSLPVLSVDDAARELPQLREAWAWAHVQASLELTGSEVERTFSSHPERFVARLLCPRRLMPDTYYRACLVPSFDAGRRAGLRLPRDADPEPRLAWTDATAELELPVYTSWRFRTATEPGDFESLVKRLTPRTLGDGVGMHALDIGDPGSERLPLAPGVNVGFRGALVSPSLTVPPWPPGHKLKFQGGMRGLMNEALAADSGSDGVASGYDPLRDDPAVAPPAYGALAAGRDEISAAAGTPRWLADANLDPVARSAAGLGAEVVRKNQEALVATAWDQAGELRQVNRVLNHSRLALEVGRRVQRRVANLSDALLLQLSSPTHGQIKTATSQSLAGRLAQSALPHGLFSAAFRRRVRPGTPLARAASKPDAVPLGAALTERLLADPEGALSYAAFTVPGGTVFIRDEVAQRDSLIATLQSLDLSTAFGMGMGGALPRSPSLHPLPARPQLSRERSQARVATAQFDRPDILVSPIDVAIDADPSALPIGEAAVLVRDALDPSTLLSVRVRALISAPASVWTDEPVPARLRFSPLYTGPLYELLVKLDPELLLPGIGAVPKDTLALAKLNQVFVEAFLLGANFELAREFIWREVPVDPAGTWLTTFWDPVEAGAGDIAAVSGWSDGPLGSHAPPDGLDPERVLVLLVKGDLLRRYPRTLVYAVPALWQENTSRGEWVRVEDPGATPLHPRFVGALGPDRVFLGFEFAQGTNVDRDVVGTTVAQGAQPGWFFVFEQPPTEPRFGLDVGLAAHSGKKPKQWRNVSWIHALGAREDASYLPLAPLDDGVARVYDQRSENDWSEVWAKDAAGMARVTLQRCVRMLVHADQMLPPRGV